MEGDMSGALNELLPQIMGMLGGAQKFGGNDKTQLFDIARSTLDTWEGEDINDANADSLASQFASTGDNFKNTRFIISRHHKDSGLHLLHSMVLTVGMQPEYKDEIKKYINDNPDKINVTTKGNYTPLYLAAMNVDVLNCMDLITFLIEKGAEYRKVPKSRMSLLGELSLHPVENIEVYKLLFKLKEDPNKIINIDSRGEMVTGFQALGKINVMADKAGKLLDIYKLYIENGARIDIDAITLQEAYLMELQEENKELKGVAFKITIKE